MLTNAALSCSRKSRFDGYGTFGSTPLLGPHGNLHAIGLGGDRGCEGTWPAPQRELSRLLKDLAVHGVAGPLYRGSTATQDWGWDNALDGNSSDYVCNDALRVSNAGDMLVPDAMRKLMDAFRLRSRCGPFAIH